MNVGIVGIRGLGHLAIKFARAMGSEVTVLSSSPNKEGLGWLLELLTLVLWAISISLFP